MAYSTEQLSNIECIRDATKRYCRGVDRLDEALMKSAYWPNATDNHGVCVGNAWEFSEMCMNAHLRWRTTDHCIYNHSIELDPDGEHARGELYNVTYLFQKDADVLDTWYGRYLDIYEKRDEEWRILERTCVHHGTKTETITAMAIDSGSFTQGDFDRNIAGKFSPE